MEKAESLSFPQYGSGGREQSLHNEILVGAKRIICCCLTFLLSFVNKFSILIPTPSYHTLCRIMNSLRRDFHKPEQKHSKTMTDAMEIAPNEGMPALPPLPCVTPVVHAPGEGVGQNWPLTSAGIAVTVAATPQPRDEFLERRRGGVGRVR
jgi:hypothetical protein